MPQCKDGRRAKGRRDRVCPAGARMVVWLEHKVGGMAGEAGLKQSAGNSAGRREQERQD